MYAAKVGRIESLTKIEKADNIQTAYVYGTPVVVSKDAKVGDIGLLFIEGGQIAPWFLRSNNLYSSSMLNEDNTKKGYFDDNGRVRAQTFRGAKSEGFFCPLSYLGGPYVPGDPSLPVGTELNKWSGVDLCWKYIKGGAPSPAGSSKREEGRKFTFHVPAFEEHKDTKQWRFIKDYLDQEVINQNPIITLTVKLHGTSGRYGKHEISWSPIGLWFENKISDRNKWKPYIRRVLNNLLRWNVRKEYQYVTGSRRKVLTNDKGFYGNEQFRYDILEKKLMHVLTPGMSIYGEIVGWHPDGKPFMSPADLNILKDKEILKSFRNKILPFKYNLNPGEMDFYVYRITQGGVDMSHRNIINFCNEYGLNHVPTLYSGPAWEVWPKVKEVLADIDKSPNCDLDPETLKEGYVVRVDWPDGRVDFYKEKTFVFKVCEGLAKEKEVDLEDVS